MYFILSPPDIPMDLTPRQALYPWMCHRLYRRMYQLLPNVHHDIPPNVIPNVPPDIRRMYMYYRMYHLVHGQMFYRMCYQKYYKKYHRNAIYTIGSRRTEVKIRNQRIRRGRSYFHHRYDSYSTQQQCK